MVRVILLSHRLLPFIQTTFVLDGEQELSLRVKFSSGKEKGWSSIKFAGELGLLKEHSL